MGDGGNDRRIPFASGVVGTAPGADSAATAVPALRDPDQRVDLASETASIEAFGVLDALDTDLVGLHPVKTRLREVASLLLIDRLRRDFGLQAEPPSLHMCFTGSPGTGKTTVALRLAAILHRLGYIPKGHLVSVTRDDLVGQYVGHTAPKTRAVLERAMGGVLFIDEAYYLYRAENDRDYGQEAIELLLQVMEDRRHELVVVLAGYRDRMDAFFGSNPGMSSRIAHHIDFPDYTRDELLQIAARMMERQGYRFSDEAQEAFDELVERRMAMPRFANARSVRNALERTRLRHANRVVQSGGLITRDDLLRIEESDVRASSIFLGTAQPRPEAPACPTS
jgi:probable Rubsico expression protein CbbX